MTPSVGSLSNGLFTAPSVINTAQSVTITATSVADPTKSASATVQLTPIVSIGINPLTATLTASQSQQFTAAVTGNANTSVTWSMTPSVGSLSNGLFTAPSVINTAQSVTITATSVADPTKSASATVRLTPIVSVGINPLTATLAASQSQQFTAAVTGNANTSVTWSMTPSVGSLSNGLYTAPSVITTAQSVTITATSVADPTKSASATVQLTPIVSIGINPLTATLAASQSQQFTAAVTGSANTSVTWSMTPSVGSLSNGLFTAPSVINAAQSVTITATSVADPTKSASATVQLTPIVSVGINPLTATLAASQSQQFTAAVTGNANTSVTWSMTPSVGSLSNGLYTAPSVITTAQSVTITATSVADPTKSASATVQLTPIVSIGINPLTATLAASQSKQFTAAVTGSANTSVTWSMTPWVGSLSNGLFTAPSVINTAQSVTITATSVADPTKSASATVRLTSIVSVGINPLTAILTASQSLQFTAVVTGSANTSVTWSMASRRSIGSLANGLYTAPSVIHNSDSVTITATSVADPTKSASAVIQLKSKGAAPTVRTTSVSNVTAHDSLQISTTAGTGMQSNTSPAVLSAASLKPGPMAPDSMVTVFGDQLGSRVSRLQSSPFLPHLGIAR